MGSSYNKKYKKSERGACRVRRAARQCGTEYWVPPDGLRPLFTRGDFTSFGGVDARRNDYINPPVYAVH